VQFTKFVTAVLVLFVWGFLFDKFLSPIVMGSSMSGIPGVVAAPAMMWLIIGGLVGSGVLVWVYEKVQGSFGSGTKGGVMFGLYAGILMNFPLWLYHTMYVAWPYRAMWHFTLVNIVLMVINGAIIGLVYQKVGAPKSA
jgi:hypothetical protein